MSDGFGKILVTGGAGFIGSHIVDRLLDEGYKVRVIDDLSTGDKQNLVQHKNNQDFEFVQGDIRETETVKMAVKGVEAVIHEAALVSVSQSIEKPLLSNSINVIGTLNLLKACSEEQVKRFVFASSCAVYGDTNSLPIKEDVLLNPLSPYAADKIAAENYIKVFGIRNNMETVCLRYFNVYGPRQKAGPYSGVISVFVNNFIQNITPIIFGDGTQTRDFVSVNDVVESNLCALSQNDVAGKVFNICTGKPITINQVLETVQKVTGKLEIKPVYKNARIGDIQHSFGDETKAKMELKFEAKIQFKDGLKDLMLEMQK